MLLLLLLLLRRMRMKSSVSLLIKFVLEQPRNCPRVRLKRRRDVVGVFKRQSVTISVLRRSLTQTSVRGRPKMTSQP